MQTKALLALAVIALIGITIAARTPVQEEAEAPEATATPALQNVTGADPTVDLLAGRLGSGPKSSGANTPGSALYAQHCASCHGVNLEGQADWHIANADGILPAPPHDDSGHTWHHDDQTLIQYTRLGGAALMAQAGVDGFKSGMPGFGQILSDAEIIAILDYIKSRWSDRARKVQRDRTRAATGAAG